MHRLAERRVTYVWLTIALALFAGLAITLTTSQSQAKARTGTATAARPTVVLVNGAWANNAAWSGVIERLETEGYTVDAPPNPLQSLTGDAATIADLLKTIKGPIVLVGHSYGGAVITNAATGNRNVKAIPPAIQLFMAQRIHAHITKVRAGHLSMVADPGVVANVITAAAKATG